MTARPRAARRIVLGFVWLAAFSALYTAGDALGIWPPAPTERLRDLDLFVGAAAVAALAAWLLTRP
ncbi:MAG TPA: hypothetical protein VEG84_07000 [Thermoanaerobaculia bacterium]|nr:hypothetical protein [Thermoanaerobaculia bacterium]